MEKLDQEIKLKLAHKKAQVKSGSNTINLMDERIVSENKTDFTANDIAF